MSSGYIVRLYSAKNITNLISDSGNIPQYWKIMKEYDRYVGEVIGKLDIIRHGVFVFFCRDFLGFG